MFCCSQILASIKKKVMTEPHRVSVLRSPTAGSPHFYWSLVFLCVFKELMDVEVLFSLRVLLQEQITSDGLILKHSCTRFSTLLQQWTDFHSSCNVLHFFDNSYVTVKLNPDAADCKHTDKNMIVLFYCLVPLTGASCRNRFWRLMEPLDPKAPRLFCRQQQFDEWGSIRCHVHDVSQSLPTSSEEEGVRLVVSPIRGATIKRVPGGTPVLGTNGSSGKQPGLMGLFVSVTAETTCRLMNQQHRWLCRFMFFTLIKWC